MSTDETDDWAGGDERGAASDDITGAAPVSPEPPATGQVDPTVGTEVASEEAPEAPSLKELAERTAVGFAPSDTGPCSSGLGGAMPYATKGLCINVRKHCIDLFHPKNGRRPQVKQSRAMLDMEEGGAYLAADVLGLPMIPEVDARTVGSEIRGRFEPFKAEVAAARKEAGKKATRMKVDAAERLKMVEAAARSVERQEVKLSLPSKKRCAAVAAASRKAEAAAPAEDDWKARGWRVLPPPAPEEPKISFEIQHFLDEDLEAELAEAEEVETAANTTFSVVKKKADRLLARLKKWGTPPTEYYAMGHEAKYNFGRNFPDSVREKREVELVKLLE